MSPTFATAILWLTLLVPARMRSYSTIMAKLEIELKFPAPPGIGAKVESLGARAATSHVERDHYFNAPDRDFAATNEAFRIRRCGQESCFTYKGPRQAGPAKTLKEIEVSLAKGEEAFANAVALVESLGFRAVAVVEKRREYWSLSRSGFAFSICIDDVREVGQFVEVEIVTDEAGKAEAEQALLKLCSELGLANPEPRSYLRMFLAKRES
jgi:adenylate cyclase class 2